MAGAISFSEGVQDCRGLGVSMRHQGRHGYVAQHRLRGPAEDRLAQTRTAIGAHDDHIGAEGRRSCVHRARHIGIACGQLFPFDVEAVPGEMLGKIDGVGTLVFRAPRCR